MKPRNWNSRRITYKGQASEILEPIVFEGYTIKVLRHGNTGHILYYAPRLEDLEPCWTMDLTTAQNGVLKFNEQQTGSSDLQSVK
jgi:hypothetical protein